MSGSEPTVAAGTHVDGYRIEALLGAGGMGEVYRARDLALDRMVALKMVSRTLARDPTFVARFEREARAASAVSHHNVAQIHAYGVWQGRPYFVMEHVRGRSLAEIVRRDGRRSGSAAIGLIRQAAEGLRAAWECDVIHRDVKPANLMVDASGTVKVVDFGLARRQSGQSDLSRTDMVLGTPAYMSPEQALAQGVDFRTDIYSLGATFYYLLTGEPPFGGETPIAVMMRHVHDPVRPVRELNPLVPGAVAEVIERMLAKDPDQRYGSWDDVIVDLDAVSRSRPSRAAPPPSAAPGPAPRGRPSPALLAAAAVAVVVLAVAVLGPVLAPEPPPAGPEPATDGPSTVAPDAPGEQNAEPGGDGRPPSMPRNTFEAIVPALQMAHGAKTLASMRRVDVAVQMYQSENGVLPGTLEQLAGWYELHPASLLDAWNRRLEYEPLGDQRYRVRSRGADGVRATADDIVIENGYVIQGEPGLPIGR